MMKPHNIELAGLSRYRSELMGAAMIFIILFHVGLARHDPFYGLKRMGNVGVDMFLFLSGIGLWFSWVKTPSFRHFYFRRFIRIFPAWLIIACIYYIPRMPVRDLSSLMDLIGEVTINWHFWRDDELTFWYIPAILALYLAAPLYMWLIRRSPVYRWLPVAMIAWCMAVEWVLPIHQAVGHIEIFWSRVPIFFIGINMGELVRQKRTVEPQGIWLILLLFAGTLATCLYLEQVRHGRFPLFAERMLYIPLTVTACLLLDELFAHQSAWLNRGLRFVGAASLECYLIHAHFVLNRIPTSWSYWPKFLVCFIVTLPLAWLLMKTADAIARFLSHRLSITGKQGQ